MKTETNQFKREYKNKDLKKVYEIAKDKGYKLFTFESNNKHIEQIFIENKHGDIGSCSAYFGGISFSTVHKPKQNSGNGTGFGKLIKGQDFNIPEDLDICFISYPYWAGVREANIKKYCSWDDYLNNQTILKYYELK